MATPEGSEYVELDPDDVRTLIELARLTVDAGQGRLRRALSRYQEGRQQIAEASTDAELAAGGSVVVQARAMLVPAVLVHEGAATATEVVERLEGFPMETMANAEAFLRWAKHCRGASVPPLDDIFSQANEELGYGDFPPWPDDWPA